MFGLLVAIFLVIGWFSTTGVKTQLVRLLDIIVYGPFLIWLSTQVKEDWQQILLLFMGATTMAYNARNYWKAEMFVKDSAVTHPACWTMI